MLVKELLRQSPGFLVDHLVILLKKFSVFSFSDTDGLLSA